MSSANHSEGNIDDFGMDTISLAGPLEAKLKAVREAGFTQIMLSARDIVGHADGIEAAVAAVRTSGCASPASRCCAISKASPAICTTTRSTLPRPCWTCATCSTAGCCWCAPAPRPMPRPTWT
jgi:hypothetical protein